MLVVNLTLNVYEMKKIILSGGGTGGHLYPAVAVAECLKSRFGDDVELLFVGAEGKMEMEKVPSLGYHIVGLPIAGLQRKFTLANLLLPFKVIRSLCKARATIKNFGADIVVGFGGYASAPVLFAAQRMGVSTIIQEQNSYAGVTNKLLAKGAKKICVAYQDMDKFFAQEKIVLTGNPLRANFLNAKTERGDALKFFGLSDEIPVLLVVGGSLGSRTLNNMMKAHIDTIVAENKFQVIWQTGKYYDAEMTEFMSGRDAKGVWRNAFIERMDYAYAAADLVVSRSGACSVSELCLLGKPTIFVPSPNVAEDHQTKNAEALSSKSAALMVADKDAVRDVISLVSRVICDAPKLADLSLSIKKLALEKSADKIVDLIEQVIREYGKEL